MRTSTKRSSRANWTFPIWLGLAAAVAAFFVAWLMPKQYKSDSTIYFPAQGNDTGSLGDLRGLAKAALGAGNSDKGASVSMLGGMITSPQIAAGPQTAIAVLDSTRTRQTVVDKLGLDKAWKLSDRKAIKRLEGSVTLNVDKNGLLAIEATDPDPGLTQKIVNAYIDTLDKLSTDLSLNIATKNRKFIEGEVATTRKRIVQIEHRLLMDQRNDPNLMLTLDASDAVKGIVDLETELIKARTTYDGADRILALTTDKARAVIKAGPDLPMQTELGKDFRANLASLEYNFAVAKLQEGPDNPHFIQLKNQLDQARKQYRDEIARQQHALDKGIAPEILKLEVDKEAARVQVASMTRALDDIKSKMDSVPGRQIKREALQRELRITAGSLEFLVAELEKAKIAETRDPTNFIVIDTPDMPDEPFAPRKGFAAGMAGVAGLLLGVAILVARSASGGHSDREPIERDVAVV